MSLEIYNNNELRTSQKSRIILRYKSGKKLPDWSVPTRWIWREKKLRARGCRAKFECDFINAERRGRQSSKRQKQAKTFQQQRTTNLLRWISNICKVYNCCIKYFLVFEPQKWWVCIQSCVCLHSSLSLCMDDRSCGDDSKELPIGEFGIFL